MVVMTFASVLERGGRSMKDNVQRPDSWDWSPEKLTSIQPVKAFKKVSEGDGNVQLALLDCFGKANVGMLLDVDRASFEEEYVDMGSGCYGKLVGSNLRAVIANQPMIITDENKSFDFGVGEGVAIVKGDGGHGGKFVVYQPHQFIFAG